MNPVYKKAGALALSVGVLGALVTHAAISGCKPASESPPTVAKDSNANTTTTAASTVAASASVATPEGAWSSPIPKPVANAPSAAPSAAGGGVSGGLEIEDPEWLPASKAGPVFRPKSKPTPSPTSAPPPSKQTGKPQ